MRTVLIQRDFMLSRVCLLALALFGILSIYPAAASAAKAEYIDSLIKRATQLDLAHSRAWLALVHYKPGGGTHHWISQADDDAFFLSPDGKYDPQQELFATLRSFNIRAQDVDSHPQCRFPARYHWLAKQLEFDQQQIQPVVCNELNTWFNTLRPGSLTLVFPAAYINSPSSMFGHTLLRVNTDDYRKDSPLVAHALNYAANIDASDNALVFTFKGLVGGYPGAFSIVPYYKKINEYRDLENRDIWEYDLNFSFEEVMQLMRHAWEVRHIQFDYFFFTENCSYHMLSLMEAARPELDLTDHFDIKAIPSDTVRAVFDAGLVQQVHYRPSSTTILSQHAAQLGDDNAKVLAIVAGKLQVNALPADLSPLRQARIYEQVYDYARFLSTANPAVKDVRSSINWQVLAARSALKVEDVWPAVEPPSVRTEQGHRTSRVASGLGRRGADDYLSVEFRPAYHDVLDPPGGYSDGAQINFFNIAARYYSNDDEIRLDKFTFIDVLSMTPRSDYFRPLSWAVNFSLENQPSERGYLDATQLIVDGGVSFQPVTGYTLSLLGEVNTRASSRYHRGYSAGAGVKLGLLKQGPVWSMQSSLSQIDFSNGESNQHQQFTFAFAYHIDRGDSLRLSFERAQDYDEWANDLQFSWRHFF
jgi:hypothetical protein